MKKRYDEFFEVVQVQMQEALKQRDILDQTVEIIKNSILQQGIIHVFGCGHSQMFGEELCFRTGGLVPVNAIMIPQYNIYPNVKLSQLMERQEGVAHGVLETLTVRPEDTMIIVSVSGRNAAGIDMAIAAREKGMNVIAVSSLKYTNHVTSRHSSKKLLKEVSDVTIDLCGIPGDAVLEDPRIKERFASTSTVVGMSILIGVMAQVTERLADEGYDPEIWVSGNLDRGDAVNKAYIEQYHGRISIL